MTPSIANHLNESQVQALLASAPPASGARLRALSIEKSSDSARKQLCSGLATLCQMEVQLVGGQRLDQATARELHGLMISLHCKVDGLLKLNSGGLCADADLEERGDFTARTGARRQRARRDEADDGDDDDDDDDERHPRGPGVDPARTSTGKHASARASTDAHASASNPRRSAYPGGPVPQGPPPPPRASLFQMYTPAPPPPAPPPNFDRARVIPARGIQIGAVACADPGVEPVQGAVIGIYEPAGYPWYLALNLNEPLAIAVFGSPGGGKTYFKGVVVESFLQHIDKIHLGEGLGQPGCVIALRVGDSADIPLDHLAAVLPNHHPSEPAFLWGRYEARPAGLTDQVILCLAEEVAAYRARYPYALVLPIQFALRSLSALGFNALMGVHKGRNPLYLRAMGKSLRALRMKQQSTLADLQAAVAALDVSSEIRKLAQQRLDLIDSFVDEEVDLRSLLKPGRLIQVAISTESLVPEDAQLLAALVLDVLVLQGGGDTCPLLVDLDEAHTLMDGGLLEQVIETLLRRRRHLRAGVIACTHSPKAIKKHLLSLFEGVALYRSDDADGLKHLSEALSVFKYLTPDKVARLEPGTAIWWAARYFACDKNPDSIMSGDAMVSVEVRPRVSHHGGATRRAIPDEPPPPRGRYGGSLH